MEERRRSTRMPMTLPVHIEGHDTDGAQWTEMSKSADASMGGLCFQLAHAVDRGSLLHLSVPLPKRFRRYDPVSPSYKIFALVVREVEGQGPYRVGVAFMGQHAPKGHLDNPGMRYLAAGDAPTRRERRGERRLDIYMNVRVRRLGGEAERTIAENLGRHGARTLTSLPVDKGEVVEFEELDGAFKTRAEVRNLYVGEDRIPRLNLRFLDAQTPARLLPAS